MTERIGAIMFLTGTGKICASDFLVLAAKLIF
jgi:hypothetical protein